MNNKSAIALLLVTLLSLPLTAVGGENIAMPATSAADKTESAVTAFAPGESLTYNLYYNWQLVWVKVGRAKMTVRNTTYNGQSAYCASLTTGGGGNMDKVFVLRDTLLSYTTPSLKPLYYRKGALEGKRYTVDEVNYSYRNGKTHIRQTRLHKDGRRDNRSYASAEQVYDMMSVFLLARNYNISSWKEGHAEYFPIAHGYGSNPARLKFLGRKTIKADNGTHYACLELSYVEQDNGKWREIAHFYVTDDDNHIPVRIDLSLKFGSAKAYLTGMSGVRNAVTSKTTGK